jgi:hypothetical protein
MNKVTITTRAVSLVEEYANQFETEHGPGYVPVIVWVMGDRSSIPQFALCFERRDVVDLSRIMECEGRDVEIFQYAPDGLFEKDGRKIVDLRDDKFVIVDANESAS